MSWQARKYRNSQRGFTLIEVLVAITVLALGLVSVVEAMGRTQQALRISKNLVSASMILEEQITEAHLEVLQRDRLSPSTDNGQVKFPGRVFNWSRSATKYYDDSIEDDSNINTVEVSVKWDEGPHRKNELLVGTLIMNRDMEKT